jgi:two-component sensor histidine kinase
VRLKSLSSRLFVVAAVALAPAIAIAISSVLTVQRDRTADMHSDAQRSAELVALEVEQTVAGVESVLRTIASAPIVRRSEVTACSTLLADTVREVTFLKSLLVMNADGTVRCSPEAFVLDTVSERDFFAAALASDRIVTGTFAEAGEAGAFGLPVALRIGGTEDAPPGVAIAYLDLSWLERRLQTRSLPPGGSLTIVDRNAIILARVPEPEKYVGTPIRPEYHYLLEEPRPGSLEVISQDGTLRILGYYPPAASTSGLYVSAGYSVEEGFAITRTVAMQALGFGIAGSALAAILAFYTTRVFIARPVGTLLNTISAWRRGDSAARTGMTGDEGEIGAAGAALDAFMAELLANREARAKADEARELMKDELEHREKNLLATVQAIARQTFPQIGHEAEFRVFSDRLNAISEANRLLKQSGWQSTPLRCLITNGVATFIGNNRDRVQTKGPDVVVKGNVATAIGMAVHELSTNAVKYGALSNDTGRVLIEWDIQTPDQGGAFTLTWTERGGPPVQKPERTGFGSKVIRHALSAQTGGTVEITHDPEGLVCRLSAPAEAVVAPAAA